MRDRLVHARESKAARAEPVALLFEQGRVSMHGAFPELEAELCGRRLCGAGRIAGPGGRDGVGAGRGDAAEEGSAGAGVLRGNADVRC